MRFLATISSRLPELRSILLALSTSILLILAFPDFELSLLAWFALIPLFFAVEFEKHSFARSFITAWISGTVFFFGTCWWLTYAPITYAGFSSVLAYSLLFCVTAVAGVYVGLFGGILSVFLRRFRFWGILAAPFVWTALEFLRLWTTGNNWNALGYSQAFNSFVGLGSIGGVPFVSFLVVGVSAVCFWYLRFVEVEFSSRLSKFLYSKNWARIAEKISRKGERFSAGTEDWLVSGFVLAPIAILAIALFIAMFLLDSQIPRETAAKSSAHVVAVQPNVPMSGLSQTKWLTLRSRQEKLAEIALRNPSFRETSLRQASVDALPENLENRTRFYEELERESFRRGKKVVILPESPMNFQYENDSEFRQFIKEFATRNNVSVLFNSAEPDKRRKYGFFNSAVMVNESGEKIVQYDKIYLLPFGEMVPLPDFLAQFVPTMVGRFSPGEEYDLLPFGDAKAGVVICFESHFPSLAREYVRNGADILVEMTNDGYLGNTPVLRQHLASAVFRAVETNRPVVRVTNVGVTAYINERGEVLDEAGVYQEATRVWSVSKSDGKQTTYVKYGDWFAWLCSVVSLGLLFLCFLKRKNAYI